MSEWIEWKGGDCPVSGDTIVDIMVPGGSFVEKCVARELRWSRSGKSHDIIKYRLHKNPTTVTRDMGDWIEWNGGRCPLESGTLVNVKFRDGMILHGVPARAKPNVERGAGDMYWHHEDKEDDIVAYSLCDGHEFSPKPHDPQPTSSALDVQEDGERYWLCCGSRHPNRHDKRCPCGKSCGEEYARFGTADEHSAWWKSCMVPTTPSALDVQEGGDHYKDMTIQPVEFCFKNAIPYLEGNVVKYVVRHRKKGGVEDLRKAQHYIALILELEYGVKE